MHLAPHIERFREQLCALIEAVVDENGLVAAARLLPLLDSITKVALLEAVGAVVNEASEQLTDGSLQVRLDGAEPVVVISGTPVASAVLPEEGDRRTRAALEEILSEQPHHEDLGPGACETSAVLVEWPSDWLRATLKMTVLRALEDSSSYGYSIMAELADAGVGQVKEGTLYPLLNRAESSGLIVASWSPSEAGPPRKYFTLTEKGHESLDSCRQQWSEFTSAIGEFLR